MVACNALQGSESVLIAQDDILVVPGLSSFLEALEWPKMVGCLSLYCPDKYLDVAKCPAFRAPDANTWGACALLFPVTVLRRIVEHDTYRDWHGNREIDSAVGMTLMELGMEFWYLFPSLVQHIGETSTLCEFPAEGWRQASSFPGDKTKWEFKPLWV